MKCQPICQAVCQEPCQCIRDRKPETSWHTLCKLSLFGADLMLGPACAETEGPIWQQKMLSPKLYINIL